MRYFILDIFSNNIKKLRGPCVPGGPGFPGWPGPPGFPEGPGGPKIKRN